MPKRYQASESAIALGDKPVDVTLLPQISNATACIYPLEHHTMVCNSLGVNPHIWILPDGFQALVTGYTDSSDQAVDAYADELNNVVFFWSEDWTEEYCLWVIAHELWHVSQFFDKGNQRSARWRGMSAQQRDKAWEREAVMFANKTVGKSVHRHFSAYKSRSTIVDTLLVHSDDVPGGPAGLHPQTPHRGGEILVRRGVLQDGLALYESRGLIARAYQEGGIFFSATDKSAGFLDALSTEYLMGLRARADWVVDSFGLLDGAELDAMVRERIGTWGAEFAMESVLWAEEAS